MKKVLYTGFKGNCNTSFLLVSKFDGDKAFITNTFAGIERDIAAIKETYDEVIMFGLDRNLKDSIRFETAAKRDGSIMRSDLDFSFFRENAERLGIEYSVSDKPGLYLCNYAYYSMLEKNQCHVIFIHIPGLKNMTDEFGLKLEEAFGCNTDIR